MELLQIGNRLDVIDPASEEQHEVCVKLGDVLKSLSVEQKEVVYLRFFKEMTTTEIAREMSRRHPQRDGIAWRNKISKIEESAIMEMRKRFHV